MRSLPAIAAWPPLVYGLVVLGLSSCSSVPEPSSVSREARLAAFPTERLALYGPVTIRWNDHQVPFIEAEDERDVPYALGLVHAHLRLGQLEFLRRVSQARLSEMGGPFLADIDHSLRILDLDRAVPEMVETMPAETRFALERFVDGVNEVRDRLDRMPPEFGTMGFDRVERWTLEDSLTIGRLAGADINWAYWLRSMGLADDPRYAALAERLARYHESGTASFGPEIPTDLDVWMRNSRSGSNCFVVAGERSASGAALIASDPHLGVQQPNLWLLGGYRTPDRTVVGMMLPGLPVMALGRNDDIAWGGTNMIGLSSSLYDISDLDPATFTTREERIRVRWWFDRTVELRETPLGPVMTDAPFLEDREGPPLALKWRGHEPSDELTAFLRMNRASNWDEFRAAFSTYAVSGQNFLYADRAGNIGQLLAIEFDPAAGRTARAGFGDPTDPEHRWGNPIPSDRLPTAYRPDEGILISSNNVPVRLQPPITVAGNTNGRVDRLRALLAERQDWDLAGLAEVQVDTYSISAHRTARAIADALRGDAEIAATEWFAALDGWDGRFDIESSGALAYMGLLPAIIERVYVPLYGEDAAGSLRSFRAVHEFVDEDLSAGVVGSEDLLAASGEARETWREHCTWGAFHRLAIQHPLGSAPLVGGPYRFGDVATPGSIDTVFKTAHSISRDRHRTTFGTQSRHLSDLSDPDENHFVLLGGQDGWIGSENFIDQIPLWQRGESIRIPMRPETIAAEFPHVMTLEGAPPGETR